MEKCLGSGGDKSDTRQDDEEENRDPGPACCLADSLREGSRPNRANTPARKPYSASINARAGSSCPIGLRGLQKTRPKRHPNLGLPGTSRVPRLSAKLGQSVIFGLVLLLFQSAPPKANL